jgi:C4-dicarboxylate-binding protein DctP
LFDLPFLFDSVADVRRVTQGPLGQQLLQRLGRQRLVGLGFFDNGFKQMSANVPLLEPAHFRKLRMRVQASRVIAQQMRALGAQPVTLAFSETRQALASGVVDGTENPISNFWTQKMHEVQTDLSLTQHGYLGYAVVVNQRFWHSLLASDQQLVSSAMRDALAYGNTIADAQNDKALASLRTSGITRIHTPTAQQRERLRTAVAPVHQELASRIRGQWMGAMRGALAKQAQG